ncbi:unnamed protein product [Schistosoma mattheei]|uniref:Uncharacterized protein n=1 Tax=Schistosoma mattheei TaxID=31246 RepID=A0A3P8DHK3_9TREM|nr:unnamed protein product [Schistosoma mattheei]
MVHTPFVPSGSWSPCAPLVWNQGFPTPLGGPFMSTNPVKAPDIRFSSSHFHKQHPCHEKAVSRTSWQRLYTRGRVRAF